MSQYSEKIGEKEVICPYCGHNKSNVKISTEFKNEFGECQNCGRMTYSIHGSKSNKQIVRCPYCNSGNTIKISTASKIRKTALFGLFAIGKTTKEWHCNDCKSDF